MLGIVLPNGPMLNTFANLSVTNEFGTDGTNG